MSCMVEPVAGWATRSSCGASTSARCQAQAPLYTRHIRSYTLASPSASWTRQVAASIGQQRRCRRGHVLRSVPEREEMWVQASVSLLEAEREYLSTFSPEELCVRLERLGMLHKLRVCFFRAPARRRSFCQEHVTRFWPLAMPSKPSAAKSACRCCAYRFILMLE